MIRIQSDYKFLEKELKRLDLAPNRAAKYLDVVLHQGFNATQAAVHIETGSLKSSGRSNTSWDGDTWKGEITYGGFSLGVNNPVTYAIYEQARGTHWAGPSSVKGDHDFMKPLEALDSLYVKAILKALS